MEEDTFRACLEQLEQCQDFNARGENAIQFMLAISLHLCPLSAAAQSARTVAQRYWSGTATPAELIAARLHCWNSIEDRTYDFTDPEISATRALLCVLSPHQQKRPDLFEVLWHFSEFAQIAGIADTTLAEALTTAFALGQTG